MNPQVLIGFIVGGVVIAGAMLLPRMMRSSEAAAATEAGAKAEAARDALETYSHRANEVARRVDAGQLKSADYDQLISRSPDLFDSAKAELDRSRQQVTAYRKAVEKHGGQPSDLTPPDPTPSGMRTAANEFDSVLEHNADILERAARLAGEARQAGAGVPGVGLVQGAVELVRASERMADAIAIRRDMEQAFFDLLGLSEELVAARAEAEALKGRDPAKIMAEGDTPLLDSIRKSIDEFRASQQESEQAAAELRERIAAARAQRDELRKQIEQARAEQLALEENGFKPGDDSGFQSFRRRYTDIAARLQQLQEDEHLLSFGGMRGATFEDGELVGGELVGGEPVEGIDELERKLAIAEDQAKRRAAAAASSEQMLARVLAGGKNAAEQLTLVSKRVTDLTRKLEDARKEVMSLATTAVEKEETALTAARAAEQAFSASAAAAQKWVSAQRQIKQEMDKTGKNERLKFILNDNMLVNVGPAGEAQARLMHGRILLQRAESLELLVSGLGTVAARIPGFQFDQAAHQAELETARNSARESLDAARTGYERYAEAALRPETAWVRKALVGYAYHMRAAASDSPDGASSLMGRSAAQISEAVKGAERHPHLAWHVAFRDHLVALGAAPAPEAPAPGEGEGNGESTTPPGEGG